MGKADGLKAVGQILDDIVKAFRGPPPTIKPSPTFKPRPGPSPTLPQPSKPPSQPPPKRPVPYLPTLDGGVETDPSPAPQAAPEPGGQPLPNSSPQSDPACEECDDEECPARTQGRAVKRNYDVGTKTQQVGYAYQHSVCPWHAHDPVNGTIEEWEFGGVTYDCLHPTECLLIETKHGYDGFLEQKDWSASGRPQLKKWANKAEIDVFDE